MEIKKNLITIIITIPFLFYGTAISSSSSNSSSSGSISFPVAPYTVGGEWNLLQTSIGISGMHMQLLYNNKVVIFDRTDFGTSNITLPNGKCRYNLDKKLDVDCTAHSVLYDVSTNTYRPLTVLTNVWCSSGSVFPNGTLVQTGGYNDGDHKIRTFTPCVNVNGNGDDNSCDWIELQENLTVRRWYASNHILPDGRIIVVGGRDNRGRAFSYEFFPKDSVSGAGVYPLKFLQETTDPEEENNLYPFLHLLPDGNLFLFANNRSVLLDYVNDKILKEFPPIPGEKRSYPATGSSVLLPIRLTDGQSSSSLPEAEVMICGGANGGAYLRALRGEFLAASKTCGRLRVTDTDPKWVMEEMPFNRVMLDMLLLPTGDVLILNGASRGTAGWENADDPVLNPVLYRPEFTDPIWRFVVLNPTVIPRLYHSSAILLPDGRILVGGSNMHEGYNFTGVKFPTDLSLESYSPPYLASQFSSLRPSILSVEGPTGNTISYGQLLAITFMLENRGDQGSTVSMIAPSFTTHSFAMNQRLLMLHVAEEERVSVFTYTVKVYAPPTKNIAPPGYYMLFVVHEGVPSQGIWMKIM